jgi:catechol 2,3-dioxygenase-like lactoylglutathione lyase family enzyme
MAKVIPTLRIYDYDKTIEFYINWLGFKIDWQHEFEPGSTPKFLQVSLRDIVLYLSEHHGDGSPGVHITVKDFEGLEAYHRELINKKYKYNRPGIEVPEWAPDTISVTVIDPVGNQIGFTEKIK